ncbi:MAG: UDP-N-acetylmuramate--L-alanine ligase, partial [Acidimicrobiia bacterium]|nr:UDP-N-acetylmuramate--L-alanine ligase [Acidimicrobiia bacterium]
RIHLIGVGGSGMSGLAKLLAQMGRSVTGSDLRPNPSFAELRDLGVEVWDGHRPDAIGAAQLVVASSAIPHDDPELAAARSRSVPVWRRPDLLDSITRAMPAVGFAGTHGKTTSTGLAVTALRATGRDPSFLVGGRMLGLGTSAHLGEPGLFVLEADEAFGTFQRLHLRALLVTNIEADHLDHYGSIDHLMTAFLQVAQATRGPVVACLDDPGARDLAGAVGAVTYGTAPEADWSLRDLATSGGRVRFALRGHGTDITVEVPRPGAHIARNAAGVIALLAELGFAPEGIAAGLGEFSGIRRRFESRGRIGGVTVIDDYAHHPTEVLATVTAARAQHDGRVVAVFQPHRYSRTEEHWKAFGPALAGADLVVLTDVYAAGEKPIPGVTGALVARSAEAAGAEVLYVPLRSELAAGVSGVLASGDLLLTLGAGDITGLATELIEMTGRL